MNKEFIINLFGNAGLIIMLIVWVIEIIIGFMAVGKVGYKEEEVNDDLSGMSDNELDDKVKGYKTNKEGNFGQTGGTNGVNQGILKDNKAIDALN